MQTEKKKAVIEAVLFASGEPVSINQLASVCGTDRKNVITLINSLNSRYEDTGSALFIKKLENSCQLCTRKEFAPEIRTALDINRNKPLSDSAMEVLAVIAYNQPVSKGFVEKVRGVNSSYLINSLVEKGLVEEAGRLDVVGKPTAYRTTDLFLKCFGLDSIANLPPVDRSQINKP